MRDRILDLARPGLRWTQSLLVRVSKGVTLGVRGLVRDGEGGVLLVRHSYVPGWHLPGGGIDPGESAREALARELDEEAGLAPVGEARFVGLFFNARMAGRDHVALFEVTAFRRLRAFTATGEILESRFFPMTAPPEGTSAATLRRLAEARDGLPPPERW